jgi:hypothetical protein
MDDVFSDTPRPFATSDAALRYHALQIPRASGTGHAGQNREESHGLYHARASSQPGNNGEALPAASSEASRPLHPTDAAAQYHALMILNPPDSDESEDSELTTENWLKQ